MDPLLLEALRFGIAILAGGIVAVISSVLAFRYARQLQREEAGRRDDGLRRALAAEVEENIARIGPLGGSARGFPRRTERSAWEAARALLDGPVLDALTTAYVEGAGMNDRIGLVDRNLTAAGVAIDFSTNAGAAGGPPSEGAERSGDRCRPRREGSF
jgi:hypothetical protein